MPRSSLGSLFYGTLFAAAFVGLSFAASSAPSEDSALVKNAPLRCGEETAPDAKAQQGLWAALCASQVEADDRSYVLATASPGDTMMRQGPELAIARLNPEFVARLASAIREARDSGLPSAGIFSAYRPPSFGIGGFADKSKSLHAYGLAVDMSGIGEPGSTEAKLWHDIAARHGVFCPYGVDSRTEWNHCQATPMKSVDADNPLRKTITVGGPLALEAMFKAGNSVIDDLPAAISAAGAANRRSEPETVKPNAVRAALASASERLDRKPLHEARNGPGDSFARGLRRDKSKVLVVATNTTHLEKSRRKPAANPKPHDARKAARASEGHHDSTRHRSHLA